MYSLLFTPHGQKDLEKLSRDLQRRILKKIEFFASQDNPVSFAKPLGNLPPTTHRFRIGDYRAAFYVSGKTIYVDRVRHRKEVYE